VLEGSKSPLPRETILLAEDNHDHVILIKRAFVHARILNPVQAVHDGAEAIAYLQGDGKYSDRDQFPLPSLMLLDLKMPNKNGFDVLEWIRHQPALQNLRVVVLTTSDRVFDVKRAYELGASSFLTKPVDLRNFVQLGPAIKGYWVWTSNAPTDPEPEGHLSPAL